MAHSLEWPDRLEVAAKERVRHAPVGSSTALDDAGVPERLERAPDAAPWEAAIDGLAASNAFRDGQAESMRPADPFDDLLMRDAVGGHRRQKALFHNAEIDQASLQFDGREVALLRDQHRASRLALAVLDYACERRRLHLAVVCLEALVQALRPRLDVDRAQVVEAAELMKPPVGRGEKVAHQVLETAGEQIAHARGALEDRAHSLGQTVRI